MPLNMITIFIIILPRNPVHIITNRGSGALRNSFQNETNWK